MNSFPTQTSTMCMTHAPSVYHARQRAAATGRGARTLLVHPLDVHVRVRALVGHLVVRVVPDLLDFDDTSTPAPRASALFEALHAGRHHRVEGERRRANCSHGVRRAGADGDEVARDLSVGGFRGRRVMSGTERGRCQNSVSVQHSCAHRRPLRSCCNGPPPSVRRAATAQRKG
jgi:hypothetical protein